MIIEAFVLGTFIFLAGLLAGQRPAALLSSKDSVAALSGISEALNRIAGLLDRETPPGFKYLGKARQRHEELNLKT
jgi:hypothetical protein